MMISPPPYHYQYAILCQIILGCDPQTMEHVLPGDIRLAPRNLAVIHLALFPTVSGLGAYAESALLIQVVHQKRQYLYCPSAWVTTQSALIAGEHFWHVPKTIGTYEARLSGQMVDLVVHMPPFDLKVALHVEPNQGGDWNSFCSDTWLLHHADQNSWHRLSFDTLKVHKFMHVDVVQFDLTALEANHWLYECNIAGASCAIASFQLSA